MSNASRTDPRGSLTRAQKAIIAIATVYLWVVTIREVLQAAGR